MPPPTQGGVGGYLNRPHQRVYISPVPTNVSSYTPLSAYTSFLLRLPRVRLQDLDMVASVWQGRFQVSEDSPQELADMALKRYGTQASGPLFRYGCLLNRAG